MAKEARTVHFEVESESATYRVESDRYCYCITKYHEREKRDGTIEETWYVVPATYYGTFESVCRRLLRIGLIESDHEDVESLHESMEDWTNRVVDAVQSLKNHPKRGGEVAA